MNSVTTRKSADRKTLRYFLWAAVSIFALLLTIFTVTFVLVPLIFMNSVELQTSYMFPVDVTSRPDYNDFERYGIDGVRNLYVNVMDEDQLSVIRLGVWHVLPEYYKHGDLTFDEALTVSKFDVIVYLHGSKRPRVHHAKIYKVLRKFFHVIAVDYRGYGDSSEGNMTESAITNDLQQLYRWVRRRTSAKIYVWGHSLGAALSTRTIALLSEHNVVPMGLILEAPFTSVADVIYHHPSAQMFAWLPWFEATFVRPLEENDMAFRTTEDVLRVNCPIMILHAKDDVVIPYDLGEKLADVATRRRNVATQGNVTYHLFPAKYGYNHMHIREAPDLWFHIRNFINVCEAYNLGRG